MDESKSSDINSDHSPSFSKLIYNSQRKIIVPKKKMKETEVKVIPKRYDIDLKSTADEILIRNDAEFDVKIQSQVVKKIDLYSDLDCVEMCMA